VRAREATRARGSDSTREVVSPPALRADASSAEQWSAGGPPLAFVLAGGHGTRLRSVLGDLPKALAPVGGEPFLLLQLRWLASLGVRRAIVCLGVGAGHVRRALKEARPWPLAVETVMEPRPLGTAGALRFALEARRLLPDDLGEALVVNGDTLVALDLAAFRTRHAALDAQQTIAVAEVEDAARFGSVEFNPEGLITAFREKGKAGPGYVSAGAYLLDTIALETVATSDAGSLERLTQSAEAGEWRRAAFVVPAFLDIGTPESYAAVQNGLPEPFASLATAPAAQNAPRGDLGA
jgi:NDP-sugar pyrophosphorylase family protein